MRRNVVSCATILWLALCFAAQASTVPLLVPHQGRLLDDNDAPVSGMRALTFAIYEVPAGGVALWTELHGAVMIEEGLFTVSLGSVTPLSQDLFSPPSAPPPFERYLEVSVDGDPLTPRIRLGTVPYSMTSTRVDGDLVTSPGELRLHGMSGSTTGTIRMTASDGGNEDSTQLYLYARKNGSFTSADFDYKATSSRSSLTIGTDEDGDALHENQLTATATFSDGSTMDITSDPDEDGTPNGQAQMKSKGSSGGIRLGGMSGSTTGTIRMAASPDSTYEEHSSLDIQGHGGTRRGMNSNVRSTALLGVDRGLKQTSYEETCDSSSARGVLSGMSGSTTGTIRMMASPDSTGQVLDVDDDGDGFSEMQAHLRLGTSNGGLEISSDRFGSGPRQSVSMDGSFSHARTTVFSDFDRDGHEDVVIAARTDSSGGSNTLDMDSDDDGLSDYSVRSAVTEDSATFRLNGLPPGTPYIGNFTVSTSGSSTKGVLTGMSGSTTGTIRMAADGSGGGGGGGLAAFSSLSLDADLDGDGQADRDITADCDDTDARLAVTNIGSSGQDGVSIECGASSRRVRMGNLGSSGQDGVDMEVTSTLRRLTVGNIGSSGQDGVGIEVDATSRRLTVGNIGSSGQDGVAMEVDASSSRLAVHNIGSSGQDGVSIEATSTGARLAIDTASTTHPITVGGGAYCDGATWTNASDAAAKENFARVDGEELLERIADLEITRWNYKAQPGVEHIGPTAQDFKAAFGVGLNDKSISTIDPSGIALAAIKELQKQNAELRAQLEALNRKVESLSATR